MKIAFINQPSTLAVPIKGCDSLGIWTYRVALRLSSSNEVIFYGKKPPKFKNDPSKVISYSEEGIQYRGISPSSLDQWLKPLRVLDRYRIVNPKRPIFASRLYNLGHIRQIAQDLKQQNCNIIHLHNYPQFVPIVKQLNPNSKIVLHMHCEWLTQLDRDQIAQRLSSADLVLGCSEYITQKIRDRFPEYANRCQTVFNGVDVDIFSPNQPNESSNQSPKQLLYVGRVSPEKGVHVLIEAFNIVARQYPEYQLKIVGPEAVPGQELLVGLSDNPQVAELKRFYKGSYLQQLKNAIHTAVKDRVIFTGGVSQTILPQLYQEADILINPSLSEAFGMSLIEAMATETPVIGARVGGMQDVILNGQTGLFFESNNASDLAKAILHLLDDENLRTSMGKAGRERVIEYFSWEKIAQQLEQHYQKI
ncbi:glycosyltransferase family 4 protein [Lyngbya sp. PCC 8106]|uniref:glycosyltransferase family 4 protein n=1 Tax=Lyngbya sp. (strain PCC 8106) TaxID=313612 RepID=UPI0000EA8FAC|nr:glycosyltransferase family 4 protein [Lyngbya sp. PCC 8106]EAW36170.1 putative membrane-anchored glycosyltransferase protein [Lyngbya sp. PCC 8106]